MRVAYLCCDSGIPIFGAKGAAVHVREMGHALEGAGCDLHFVVARQGGDPPQGWTLPVHQLQLSGWPAVIQDLLKQESEAPGWERRVKDWQALAFSQYLSQAARPLLRRLQPDVIYERYSLFSWAGQALAAELGIPHVVEINAPLAREQALYRSLELRLTALGLEAQLLLQADRVVAVSREVEEYVLKVGVPPERLLLLPNGVDAGRFHPMVDGGPIRQALGLESAFVIGFVGSLKPWHGLDGLLSAAAGLPEEIPWRLLLVGDGPQRGSIAGQASSLGILDRLIFTGSVPNAVIPPYLAAFDVAVAPYPALDDYYFSPLKLFEYMAMSLPVIAPALGQIAEVIDHGENGWLYPAGDIQSLQAALIHLWADPELRGSLGRKARADVVAQHTWAHNAGRLLAWIGSLRRKQSRLGEPMPGRGEEPIRWAGGA